MSSTKILEKTVSTEETSTYPLYDKDKSGTEGKTTVRPLANVIQKKKRLRFTDPNCRVSWTRFSRIDKSLAYIINRLHMEQIACVESEFIVPGVIYAEGKLRHPFRLYSNEEGSVCVLVCELSIMIEGMHSVLDTVTKWALNNKVKQVMVLDGIAVEGMPNLKRTPIIMSSDGEVADEASLIQDIGEEPNGKEDQAKYDSERNIYPTTAYIGGLAGGLLSSCLSNGAKK